MRLLCRVHFAVSDLGECSVQMISENFGLSATADRIPTIRAVTGMCRVIREPKQFVDGTRGHNGTVHRAVAWEPAIGTDVFHGSRSSHCYRGFMGHTGTGPYGSSNSPRSPEVSEYQPEMWLMPKDAIYAALSAIEAALGYMPQIKTDVPQWQKTVEQDIIWMQCALEELRKLSADSSR